MRAVMNVDMVAHVWAQEKQSEGRTPNGIFWFKERTLHSYETPIGRAMEDVSGGTVFLMAAKAYSSCTSKHFQTAIRAIGTKPWFRVRHIGAAGGWAPEEQGVLDHQMNLAEILAGHDEFLGAAERVRTEWYADPSRLRDRLVKVRDEAKAYATAFGLPEPEERDIEGDVSTVTAFRKEKSGRKGPYSARESATERALAAERAARGLERFEANRVALAERDRAVAEELDARRKAWIAGADVQPVYKGSVSLRIKGATLETSLGARVPMRDATRAFRFIKAIRASGRAWARTEETVPVGPFEIDVVTAGGDVVAACHEIEWEEIARVAKLASIFDDEPSLAALQAPKRKIA